MASKKNPIQPALDGLPLGGLRYLDRAGSTNEVALTWLGQGAPDLSLVAADEQTAGRGRFNRRWVTLPGAALAFSLVVRPKPEELQHIHTYSPWAALALAQTLETDFGLRPEIKWPNDVLLSRQKVSGILVESAWTGDRLDGVVIGVGVNVTPAAVPPAGELRFPATSVEAAAGQPVDRWRLLRGILEAMLDWRSRLGTRAFFQAWEDRLAFRGERVVIRAGDGVAPDLYGRILGIAADGSLRLAGIDENEFTVQVGDVLLRKDKG